MASKDDLSEQLGVTTKLAAQVERMAVAADRVSGAYKSQIDAVQQLANLFNQINTQASVQSVEALNKTVTAAAEQMKKANQATESSFQKFGKKVEETSKTVSQKFPKAMTIAVAALSGFKQGISNVVALGKGFSSFAIGIVDGLANVTASIIAIPIKIFEGLVDMAAQSAGGSNELAQALEDLRKQFGAFSGPTNKAIISTSKELKGFSDTGLSAFKVFGNMAKRLEDLGKLAGEMGPQFNKFHKEFEDNGGALLAYQKGLGLDEEQMKSIGVVAQATGQKMGKVLKDITKFSLALADSDTDAKLLSRDMGKMAGDVKHFGQLGAKELGEVAVYARKLGVEVDKMASTLDKFESFDTAAESAAQLSQAFGANIDAFKLMEAQNPAEQFDMLRKAMFAAGKSAETMNRQELKLLAQQTGMDEQTAKLAFSMKNQGSSLDSIKKKSGDAEKKTLTQAQAMGKLADAIERLVMQGQAMKGGFWAMFLQGIQQGIQTSPQFIKLMMNIRMALQQTLMEGVKLGRELVKLVPGVSDVLDGLDKVFDPKHFKKFFGGISQSVIQYFDPKSSDKGNLPRLFEKLQKSVTDFFSDQGPNGKKVLEGFKTLFKTLAKTAADGVKLVSEKLRDGIKFVLDLLSGKKKLDTSGAQGAGMGALGFLQEALTPLLKSLEDAWQTLKDPLKDLVHKLGSMLYGFLTSKEFIDLVKPALKVIGVLLFAPTVTRGFIGAGINVMGGAIKEMITGSMKTAAKSAEKTAEKAVSGSDGILSKMMGPLLGNPYVAAAAAIAALAVVGVGFSKGVHNLTGKMSKDIGDATDKKIGASVGGLVQMLSFGALDDKAATSMAESFARYSETFNKTVEKLFGKAFAKDLRAMMENNFDRLIDIGDIFQNLFKGDIKGATKSLGKLLYDMGAGAVDMLKFFFVSLPEKLLGWLSDGVTALADWLDKLFQEGSNPSVIDSLVDGVKSINVYILPVLGDVIGRLFVLLGDKLLPALMRIGGSIAGLFMRIPGMIFESISDGFKSLLGSDNVFSKYLLDPMSKAFYEMGNAIPFFAKYLGNAIASMTDYIKAKASGKNTDSIQIFPKEGIEQSYVSYKDNLKKTTDQVVADNQSAAQKIAETAPKEGQKPSDVSELLNKASSTVNDIERMKAGLAKVSEKDIGEIKGYFNNIKNLMSDPEMAIPTAAFANITNLGKTFDSVQQVAKSFIDMSDSVKKATADIGKKGVAPALDAVKAMVHTANELNDALADGGINKIDIKAKLGQVAKAVGLGGKASYTVNPSKEVVINVNMTVTMDVGTVERVILQRQGSIIRDRLNFATYSNPGDKTTREIPDSPSVVNVPTESAGTKR